MHHSFHPFTVFVLLLLCASVGAESSEKAPDNFDAIGFYNQAVDAAVGGDFQASVLLSDKALGIQPNFTLAQITRINALLSLDRVDEAAETLEQALVFNPDHAAVLATAASYSLKTGNSRSAIRYAEEAVSRDPSLVEAWIVKGTAHGNLGEYEEEINASQEALSLSPEDPLAMTNLEYAREQMKQTQKTPSGAVIPCLSLILLALFRVMRKG